MTQPQANTTNVQFLPSNQPAFNDEFRISSLQAVNRNIVASDSFYWPRTQQEREEWLWRQQQTLMHPKPTHFNFKQQL